MEKVDELERSVVEAAIAEYKKRKALLDTNERVLLDEAVERLIEARAEEEGD